MADTAETNVTPISADSKLTDEQKREKLRERIEAGEQRNEERTLAEQAKDAADSAMEFTKKHPFAVVGGVLLAGLAIGAMTRPGRRIRRRGGAFAELAADTAARARIGRLNSLCAIVVFPLVSWLGFACWDPYDLRLFRRLACCVSCAAACGVTLGATMMQQHQRLQHERQHGQHRL